MSPGNQVERAGTSKMTIIDRYSATKKGTAPMATSSIRSLVRALMANRFIPTGGVAWPAIMDISIKTHMCVGSMPNPIAAGHIIGRVIKMIGAASRIHPINPNITRVQKRNATGDKFAPIINAAKA